VRCLALPFSASVAPWEEGVQNWPGIPHRDIHQADHLQPFQRLGWEWEGAGKEVLMNLGNYAMHNCIVVKNKSLGVKHTRFKFHIPALTSCGNMGKQLLTAFWIFYL
jgi:hypothetical protein